jgi:pilus assembly protein CpaE
VTSTDGRESGQQGKRGEMIVICSAKGGIGRTLLAVNLAVALSKNNRLQIGLMDGDFQFGDVCLAMDLHPAFTIKDVIEDVGGMDPFALSGFLMHHSSGVKVLAAPERPEQADMLNGEVIERVCDLLLAQTDYLIVDTPVGLSERTLQFIDKADQVFVMTTLEMASIKSTKLMLETLSLLGLREKATVVVNRSTMESVIKAQDVPDILDEETPVYVPNDFQACSSSLNIGIPFVLNHGKTEIAKSVFRMAEQMISRREIAMFKPKQSSLMQSLFKRVKSGTSLF